MAKIRILKASYLYAGYLAKIYNQFPNLKDSSYQEQYDVIMKDKFGWSDLWKTTLESTGDFEVMEVMVTNEILQKRWAEEQEVNFSIANWLLDILQIQIEKFQPDVLFAHNNIHLTASVIAQLKKKNKNIKLVLGYDGTAMNNMDLFSECDIVMSCLESTADFYSRESNALIKGYYFPLAFETKILDNLTKTIPEIPFSFIGSLVRGEGYHNKRIQDLTKLAFRTPLEIYSLGFGEPYEMYRYLQRNRLYKLNFEEFWQVYTIGKHTKPAVFGLSMYEVLAASKVTFNSHIDSAEGKAANMRLFEATGVGTCLLTDYKDNLADFFDIDNEVVTYRSIPECIDKVKNLLRDEKLRTKIAFAGQKRTLKDHSYENRINKFSVFLKEMLSDK